MELNATTSKPFSWADVNWDALRRLRARFLSFEQGEASADYWRSHSELASYDFTFAERIGWKWDTVLAELRVRGWKPPQGAVLDYGCGTGVAGRRVVAWMRESGVEPTALALYDRSTPAMHFASGRARESFAGLPVTTGRADEASPAVLVISHVLNELSPQALESLLALAQRAETVLWVEPGTAAVSRSLIAARERLVKTFHPVAPCTHARPCGMLTPENERHWCHHFARVPREVFQDSGWGRFARTVEVDLGTMPFSSLVLDRRPWAGETDASRVIGTPREFKGFCKVLCCQADGVKELVQQKRDDAGLFRELKKEPGSLYQWERSAEHPDRITGGARIF
jgi:hypothetical protein